MTEQEIEKLREKLGSDYSVKRLNGAITVELADIWKGVEFAECLSRPPYTVFVPGEIYPIWLVRKYTSNSINKSFKPSTEAAYVEQLKAKAKELYGEIKDGDRFDRSEMGFVIPQAIDRMSSIERGWDYSKAYDQLYFGDLCLYNKGKWAKKIERVRVEVSSICYLREPIEYMGQLIPSDTIDCTVHFTIEGNSPRVILKDDFRNLLSKCLEDYLNKIP